MSHSHSENTNTLKLIGAVVINILLTAVQVIAGIMSGSLSLLADALHNLSDAGALVVAIIAKLIGNKPATKNMPYGYKRAEIIGVLINSSSLIIVGVYLISEAFDKYFNPSPINGWIVFAVAAFALIIDLITAYITYTSGAKNNMNIKAAFVHNVSDALASISVIIAGALIILFNLYIVDVIATLLISLYVIYHGVILLIDSTKILMQSTPNHIDTDEIVKTISKQQGVQRVKSIRVWQSNEHDLYLDAKIDINETNYLPLLRSLKEILKNQYSITDSTIEINYNQKG